MRRAVHEDLRDGARGGEGGERVVDEGPVRQREEAPRHVVRERRKVRVEGVRDHHGLQQFVLLALGAVGDGGGGGLAFGAHVCLFVVTPETKLSDEHLMP